MSWYLINRFNSATFVSLSDLHVNWLQFLTTFVVYLPEGDHGFKPKSGKTKDCKICICMQH